jgi:hypothetical protein
MSIDLTTLTALSTKMRPMYAHGWSHRFNFDGFATFSGNGRSPTCTSYLQLFRDGTIEAVEASIIGVKNGGRKLIPSLLYEREIIKTFEQCLLFQRDLGFDPPIFVMLTLLGVRGYLMGVDNVMDPPADPIDKDDLLLPDLIIETYEIKSDKILRDIFDAIWQAAGWPCSMNYDDNGNWVER